ncbi:hypothetical protein Y5W_02110 [Alcanivorax sp. 521-1]|uniref:Uncharacterized protein n=1 Tax=Alloalcanivorax profundimaris TaxID=2735259 RepID=A0ABS0ART5_9GAMM|nr:hypothetical protein [Alloalcanivorax profundimaris]MBF5056816.1 hypothetical protein [Alloalcanivorax profundimaris]
MITSTTRGMKTITAPAFCYLVLVLSALLLSTVARAESGLTPERYVLLDQKIKRLTVDGMAARLSALRQAPYDRDGQTALSHTVQERIGDALKEQGLTMTGLLNYGARHSDSISAWLDEHASYQAIYDDIARERERLAGQLQAIQE